MANPSIRYNHSVERKVKQVWKPKQVRQVWKPTGKVLTTIGHQWRPTGWIFDLGNQCALTKFTPPKVVSATQHAKWANPCANQKKPNENSGSNLSNSPSLSGFKCRSYRSSFDKMADVNAPSGPTPTIALPVRADDQILPHIRWLPIGKRNCYLDLEKSQSNPIYKIVVDLLKNTNFFRAFTASSNLPSIYIQQFWDTILYDKKTGCYKCQLDEQWFDLTKETLREALQITPGKKGYSDCDSKHLVHQADYLPSSKEAQATGTTDKSAKAKRIKRSVSRKTRQPRRSPKSMGASKADEVPPEEPQVADEDADYQKAVEESTKDAYALPKGPLPLVVIMEPESGKYQPLLEVPGKGKAKVTEEQVAYDLLSLQKHKKTSPVDQYIFQRRVFEPTASSFHDESPYEAGPDPDALEEDQTGSNAGAQAEGQARSNPDETSEGQAGSNPDETFEG
nr:hypothetical protein [Tanacetum cinerariifolium]